MVSINYSSREVCCKIVYYGPGLSGKTTNLQYVHEKVPSNTRGKLISLATESDRTLYFDFLPINIGSINGFAAKFQLYTVPGQVYYNATRKLVLRGVDGVVFVADSQRDKLDENIESLSNLEENLIEYGYAAAELPLVIQYNKRDLPGAMSIQELEKELNTFGRPYTEASASLGNGVFDTLKLIIKLVLEKAKNSNAQAGQRRATPVAEKTEAQSSSPTPQPASAPFSAPIPAPVVTPVQLDTSPQQPQRVSVAAAHAAEPNRAIDAPVITEATSTSAPGRQFRPYPGSPESGRDKRISPSSFSPGRSDDIGDSALEKKVIEQEKRNPIDSGQSMSGPMMAPSRRRRKTEKKRGFFKRLFGLK